MKDEEGWIQIMRLELETRMWREEAQVNNYIIITIYGSAITTRIETNKTQITSNTPTTQEIPSHTMHK
jgi:hypothetical protein